MLNLATCSCYNLLKANQMPSIVPLMLQSSGISFSLRRRTRSSSLTDLWNRGCLFREFSFVGEGISHTTPERDVRPRLHDVTIVHIQTEKREKAKKRHQRTEALLSTFHFVPGPPFHLLPR